PETREHLDKAREHLAKARTFLDVVNYPDEAGRAAYLAAFHAAQALISERTGRIARTHAGVHSQFNLLTKGDPQIDAELRHFLSDGFDLKTVSDYQVGPEAQVAPEDARAAIATAARLIECVTAILAEEPQ
ncbi:MAG TPA: HEPN domain-containing protein, partial [Stellaceae bacterium]